MANGLSGISVPTQAFLGGAPSKASSFSAGLGQGLQGINEILAGQLSRQQDFRFRKQLLDQELQSRAQRTALNEAQKKFDRITKRQSAQAFVQAIEGEKDPQKVLEAAAQFDQLTPGLVGATLRRDGLDELLKVEKINLARQRLDSSKNKDKFRKTTGGLTFNQSLTRINALTDDRRKILIDLAERPFLDDKTKQRLTIDLQNINRQIALLGNKFNEALKASAGPEGVDPDLLFDVASVLGLDEVGEPGDAKEPSQGALQRFLKFIGSSVSNLSGVE